MSDRLKNPVECAECGYDTYYPVICRYAEPFCGGCAVDYNRNVIAQGGEVVSGGVVMTRAEVNDMKISTCQDDDGGYIAYCTDYPTFLIGSGCPEKSMNSLKDALGMISKATLEREYGRETSQ